MARIKWDLPGEHLYETGTDRGVLYPISGTTYPSGVAWSGLTGVTESPSGAEETKLFADNVKYLSLRSAEEFGGTITAYTYPDEWMECDGSKEIVSGVVAGQQSRKTFGLSYRTIVGNDTMSNDYGYKIHLVYGCTASPSERGYKTVNDSPEAIEMSWTFTTTPVSIPNTVPGTFKPTSVLTIDTTNEEIDSDKVKALEDILYGTDANTVDEDGYTVNAATEPRLPLPEEVYNLFTSN
ncbi:MAG: hypothetical protein HUJ78_01155 [Mogibacterium sp.]|nr:hypothetical protein [Mogibacterium sp.]MCF0232928.1 hypothetical protein [Enterococcus sp.]